MAVGVVVGRIVGLVERPPAVRALRVEQPGRGPRRGRRSRGHQCQHGQRVAKHRLVAEATVGSERGLDLADQVVAADTPRVLARRIHGEHDLRLQADGVHVPGRGLRAQVADRVLHRPSADAGGDEREDGVGGRADRREGRDRTVGQLLRDQVRGAARSPRPVGERPRRRRDSDDQREREKRYGDPPEVPAHRALLPGRPRAHSRTGSRAGALARATGKGPGCRRSPAHGGPSSPCAAQVGLAPFRAGARSRRWRNATVAGQRRISTGFASAARLLRAPYHGFFVPGQPAPATPGAEPGLTLVTADSPPAGDTTGWSGRRSGRWRHGRSDRCECR